MRRKQKHFYNKLTLSLMSLYLFKRVFAFAFICYDALGYGVSDIDTRAFVICMGLMAN